MDALFSKTVRSGKTTYFVDVKEAKNQKKYITITSSSPSKDDAEKLTRKSLVVFDNAVDKLYDALGEAIRKLK
jgi:hypothetical protein